jgi:hypothetical protein
MTNSRVKCFGVSQSAPSSPCLDRIPRGHSGLPPRSRALRDGRRGHYCFGSSNWPPHRTGGEQLLLGLAGPPARFVLRWPRVRAAGRFCINILAEHQHPVCVALARSGGDKFEGVPWSESPDGCPLVDEAVAWLEVKLEAEYAAGDHVIVVARVEALEAYERPPLLFFRGGYGRLAN